MYNTDYIMRTIKQFSEMLAALLFNARSTGEEVSYDDLNELSSSFTGLSLDALLTMSSAQLLALFSLTGQLDINKAYASACLIHQTSMQEGSSHNQSLQKATALDLLLEIKNQLGDYLNEEHKNLTISLTAELQVDS